MMRSVLAIALLAGFSGAAVAENKLATKTQTAEPVQQASGPLAMTDAEMDKVTAGYFPDTYGSSSSNNAIVNYNAVINGFQGRNQGSGNGNSRAADVN